MRLSLQVRRQGIDSFTRDDFRFVSSKLATDPSRLILVGGQAIEVWGVLLDVPNPVGEANPLTEDVDWLGGKVDAKWLCDLLGPKESVELQLAPDFDPTLSSALAYLERPDGRILLMDFMRSIVGPTSERIHDLAVTVELHGGAVIRVMHPLLCLESRLANLHIIPAKRNGNGPMQAQWAINIAEAYLKTIHGPKAADQLPKACREIAAIALSDHGRYCYVSHDLNPLSAVSTEVLALATEDFVRLEWPHVVARVAKRQARWKEIAARDLPQVRSQPLESQGAVPEGIAAPVRIRPRPAR